MSLYPFSGVPDPYSVILDDGQLVTFKGETLSVYINAPAGTRVYFTKADFDGDQNYLQIDESTRFEAFARISGLYIKGSGSAQIIGFLPGR